jgi:hypothetical protein
MQLIFENIRFWAPFIVVSWSFGYFSTKFGVGSQYVKVPIWLFYFCGAPKLIEFPKGVLTRQGVFMQLISLFLLVFALFFDIFFPDRITSGLVGLWSSLIGSVVIVQILLRRSPYH